MKLSMLSEMLESPRDNELFRQIGLGLGELYLVATGYTPDEVWLELIDNLEKLAYGIQDDGDKLQRRDKRILLQQIINAKNTNDYGYSIRNISRSVMRLKKQ